MRQGLSPDVFMLIVRNGEGGHVTVFEHRAQVDSGFERQPGTIVLAQGDYERQVANSGFNFKR